MFESNSDLDDRAESQKHLVILAELLENDQDVVKLQVRLRLPAGKHFCLLVLLTQVLVTQLGLEMVYFRHRQLLELAVFTHN